MDTEVAQAKDSAHIIVQILRCRNAEDSRDGQTLLLTGQTKAYSFVLPGKYLILRIHVYAFLFLVSYIPTFLTSYIPTNILDFTYVCTYVYVYACLCVHNAHARFIHPCMCM